MRAGKKRGKIIFSFSDSMDFAKKVAKLKHLPFYLIEVKKFPDGELLIRLPHNVNAKGKEAIIARTLKEPNEKLIEIFFAACALKEMGAKVTLVAPYLCYMRQDKSFHKGEIVSSKYMAKLISNCVDKLITIDPHLHRYKSLNDIFKIKTKRLTAIKDIAYYIKHRIKKPLIIGPDAESYQWAKTVAKIVKCDVLMLRKKRYTSRHVRIELHKNLNLSKVSPIIIDDIISTGHTMIEVIKDLKKIKAKKVYCIGVHALLVENALKKLNNVGGIVITCNAIPNKTNKIDLSKLVAENI